MLEESVLKVEANNTLIMGDFNYPEIEHHNRVVLAAGGADAARFFNKMQELDLIQMVEPPMRVRQGQKPSTLDFIFTNEQDTD